MELRRLNGGVVNITGDAYDYIVESESHVTSKIAKMLAYGDKKMVEPLIEEKGGYALVYAQRLSPLNETGLNEIMDARKGLLLNCSSNFAFAPNISFKCTSADCTVVIVYSVNSDGICFL